MFFHMVYKFGQRFLPFCHNSRVWQTDGRTEFSLLDRVCIPCSAVKTKHFQGLFGQDTKTFKDLLSFQGLSRPLKSEKKILRTGKNPELIIIYVLEPSYIRPICELMSIMYLFLSCVKVVTLEVALVHRSQRSLSNLLPCMRNSSQNMHSCTLLNNTDQCSCEVVNVFIEPTFDWIENMSL